MFFSFVLGFFLYFPEDKSEYLPAVIKLVITILIAFLAVRFFIKLSKKEERKAKELEEKIKMSMHEKNS